MYMLWIWLAVIAICLVVELIDAGTLVSVWFSVGAVVPFIMSFWRTNAPWYICLQVLVFGIITAICLVFLRKIALKYFYKGKQENTNLDVYKNKKLKVLKVNEDLTKAVVKINSIEYTAVAEDEETTFKAGEEVEVIRFEGNKVVVKKLENKN